MGASLVLVSKDRLIAKEFFSKKNSDPQYSWRRRRRRRAAAAARRRARAAAAQVAPQPRVGAAEGAVMILFTVKINGKVHLTYGTDPGCWQPDFSAAGMLHLVMDYAEGGDLHSLLKPAKAAQELLPEGQILDYFVQLCLAMEHVHSRRILHRDLKPQNIMICAKTGYLKLCDFGSAKLLVKGEPNVSYICSRYYRAPELILLAARYTPKIDVWSMGCIFAELLQTLEPVSDDAVPPTRTLFPGESCYPLSSTSNEEEVDAELKEAVLDRIVKTAVTRKWSAGCRFF